MHKQLHKFEHWRPQRDEIRSFQQFWDNYPNHLPLLNLMESDHDPKEWNLQTSISTLNSILNSSSEKDLSEGLNLLLQSGDWRPHLVAILSLLTIDHIQRDKYIVKLWERLLHGSWVSPQILVVLSIIDTGFTSKAGEVLDKELKVTSTVGHTISGGISERD